MNSHHAPLNVQIQVTETIGRARHLQSVRIGVPLPRSRVFDPAVLSIQDAIGRDLPAQYGVLQRWPDTSIKWLLVDTQSVLGANESRSLWLREGATQDVHGALQVEVMQSSIRIDTGVAQFHMRVGAATPFSEVTLNAADQAGVLDGASCRIVLTDHTGGTHEALIDTLTLEECGSVRASVVAQGRLPVPHAKQGLRVKLRCVFHAGSARVSCEVLLHNPQQAHHLGGLWDLGDRGSIRFRDVTLRCKPSQRSVQLRWRDTPQAQWREHVVRDWSLYQDSSGGDNWDSDNHLDRNSKLSVSFPGFRVSDDAAQRLLEGARATPALWAQGDSSWLAVAVEDFWQNFPKALRWRDDSVQIALFPGECSAGFELQGGEQKRHVVHLEFGAGELQPDLLPAPQVSVDPQWIEQTAAVPYFTAAAMASQDEYLQYINSIVEGPHAFLAKREIIDEYGWRNFGDLYADHEAVNHQGPKPMVSHYNNQYDFVYGAAVQFLRSGDSRWWQLCAEAARHLIDIDIYHTNQDKAAFNNGVFWHTDHYQPAATCTHRTYSRHNGGAGYGGGPSNEHNYTTGLLYYYYVSGDTEARDAVIGLADWVAVMDDGNSNVFSLLDNSPTGLASKTVSADYHHPGRGAGNSINALLDAYSLSGERRYVLKAEELLQRCIHPRDDIAALKLDEPEYRWSYLVFLQALGKYLDFKREWGELDYGYYHARDSLLHYAAWMAAHELPYKQQLHKVELPTETWPAHDVRKAHVLHLAAKYAPPALREQYASRADYFQQHCLPDLLSFKTAYLTRPQVILCVYGHVDRYFKTHADAVVPYAAHNYQFGALRLFLAQRQMLGPALRWKLGLIRDEALRVFDGILHRLRSTWSRN